MSYQVLLTDDAAHDLGDLYDYIESHDAPEKADCVLDENEEIFSGLTDNPERGTYPNELLADGRRDMQSLLQRRLLQP